MSQPNHPAITANGPLDASDPAWDSNTGRICRIDSAGKVALAAKDLGTTNGLDVSPDVRTLYENESVQRGGGLPKCRRWIARHSPADQTILRSWL